MTSERKARYGGRQTVQESEQHASALEWARRVLRGGDDGGLAGSEETEVA